MSRVEYRDNFSPPPPQMGQWSQKGNKHNHFFHFAYIYLLGLEFKHFDKSLLILVNFKIKCLIVSGCRSADGIIVSSMIGN